MKKGGKRERQSDGGREFNEGEGCTAPPPHPYVSKHLPPTPLGRGTSPPPNPPPRMQRVAVKRARAASGAERLAVLERVYAALEEAQVSARNKINKNKWGFGAGVRRSGGGAGSLEKGKKKFWSRITLRWRRRRSAREERRKKARGKKKGKKIDMEEVTNNATECGQAMAECSHPALLELVGLTIDVKKPICLVHTFFFNV